MIKFFSEGIDHRTPGSRFNKPVLLRIFTFESVNTRLQIIAFKCVPRLKIILDSGGLNSAEILSYGYRSDRLMESRIIEDFMDAAVLSDCEGTIGEMT